MAFKSQLLNIYQTDSNAIFSIVFASLFHIIISKPISYLSNKIRWKKCWKKGGILRLSADLAFWITRTKCMQNKNGQKLCRIALHRKALLKGHKNPGPNPSSIRDLRQCLNFEAQRGPKVAWIWIVKIRIFQLLSKLSIWIKFTIKWLKIIVLLLPDMYFKWCKKHRLRVRAIFFVFATQI